MGLNGLPRILLLLTRSLCLPLPGLETTQFSTFLYLVTFREQRKTLWLLQLRAQDCLDVPRLATHKSSAPLWGKPSFGSLLGLQPGSSQE